MSTYWLLAAGFGLGLLIALRGIWNIARPMPSREAGPEQNDRPDDASVAQHHERR